MYRFRGGVFSIVIVAAGSAGVASAGCGNVSSPPAIDAPAPMIDAPAPMIDAPVDGAVAHKYDVGYIDEFTLAPTNRVVLGFLLVANVGTAPLQAMDATVVSFADDSPLVEWEFLKDEDAVMPIAPGRSAGLISPLASQKIVDSGLVTEPNEDRFMSFFMSFVMEPPAGVTFNAQAVLRIDGENVTLPFKIHTTADNMVTFHSARRVSSRP